MLAAAGAELYPPDRLAQRYQSAGAGAARDADRVWFYSRQTRLGLCAGGPYPDELGEARQHGRAALTLQVTRNGEPFGCQSGSEMHFHFGELIAHAAQTRRLRAGTVVGSGTVSGPDASRGASCIAEVRAIEMLAFGEPRTPFLSPGSG